MDNTQPTFLLSGESLQDIVQELGINVIMDELILKMYNSFVNFNSDNSIMPVRSGFNYMKPQEGLIEWMPIRDVAKEKVTIKVVAYHPQNPTLHLLPTIISTTSTYDTITGHLLSIIDGVLPTSLRTGAVSAIASRLMAHSDSKVLGIIGCGAQAVTQLHAISRVFSLDTVIYYDIDSNVSDSFRDRTNLLGLDVQYIEGSINDIISTSDIVCTATSIGVGAGPLFEDVKTKEWLHVNAVGSDFPGKIELPKQMLLDGYVCPDYIEQAMIEGECQQLKPDQIGSDLITCLKNSEQYQFLKNQLSIFDSTGMSLQDQVVVDLFTNHAKEMNIGEYVFLENTKTDTQNPYSFLRASKYA